MKHGEHKGKYLKMAIGSGKLPRKTREEEDDVVEDPINLLAEELAEAMKAGDKGRIAETMRALKEV